jgi:hypothetical protein
MHVPKSFSPRCLDLQEKIYGRISRVSVFSKYGIAMQEDVPNEATLKKLLTRPGDIVLVKELLFDRHKGRSRTVRIPIRERMVAELAEDKSISAEFIEHVLRMNIPSMAAFRRTKAS